VEADENGVFGREDALPRYYPFAPRLAEDGDE
jgi:hypothetical protein